MKYIRLKSLHSEEFISKNAEQKTMRAFTDLNTEEPAKMTGWYNVNKIITNEKEYQNSLNKENTILNKDIKKFGIYQVNQNLKFQNSEGTVQKYIKANSILFEAMKQAQLEYFRS